MKSFIVLALFVAAAVAAPAGPDADAKILVSEVDNIGVDGYQFKSATSNGISQQEQAVLKKVGNEEFLEVRGEYSYTGPDGVLYRIIYIADENGFQPQGEHIPRA